MRLCALLVPSARRQRWLQEWRGELWHEMVRVRGSGWRRRLTLAAASRGALRDAWLSRFSDPRRWRAGAPFEGRAHGPPSAPRRASPFDGLAHDLRSARRSLGAAPGYAATVLAVFAVAIGANTTIFSVVDAVLLRPLRLPDSERLVKVQRQYPDSPVLRGRIPTRVLESWMEGSRTTAGFAAVNDSGWENIFYLTGVDEPERLEGALVSPAFFELLGAEPAVGRVFSSHEDFSEVRDTVILSHDLWRRRFGGARGVVGTTILLDERPYTVLGVLDAGFDIDRPAGQLVPGQKVEIWAPIDVTERDASGDYPRGRAFVDTVVARVGSGFTIEQAQAELDALYQAGARPGEREQRIHLTTLKEDLVGETRRTLLLLVGVVGLVLLLGCVNIAGLQLARGSERRKEVAVRTALGGTSARIARQLAIEGTALAVLGSLLALLLARWGLDLFVALAAGSVPRLHEARIDASSFVFAILLALLAGCLASVLPGRRIARTDPGRWLKEGRAMSAGRRVRRARNVLVVAQVALATTLLVGGALLVRSFWELHRVRHGMRVDNVLTLDIWLSSKTYDYGGPALRTYFDRAVQAARSVPGVAEVALTSSVPFRARDYYRPGWRLRVVDAGYFDLLGVPIVRGRPFAATDTVGGESVVIVNESLARQVFGAADPIGRKLWENDPADPPPTVVGVVADVRHVSIDAPPLPAEYAPFAQNGDYRMSLLVRAIDGVAPESLAAPLRQALWRVDPDQPLANLSTLETLLSGSEAMRSRRFNLQLLGTFGLVAILLAVMGIYGVVARSVVQRRREIGVRMALGARAGDVVAMVLGQGARLAITGTLLGLAAATLVTRFLAGLLYGVPPVDPLTFGAVGAMLLVVALLATSLPARRAARVDPIVALGAE